MNNEQNKTLTGTETKSGENDKEQPGSFSSDLDTAPGNQTNAEDSDENSEEQKPKAKEPEPNVIFVGKDHTLVIEGKINNGMNKPIRMPKAEVQLLKTEETRDKKINEGTDEEEIIQETVEVYKSLPFYLAPKDLNVVTRVFGDLYKHWKPKGKKK